jgi:hypothetical protein
MAEKKITQQDLEHKFKALQDTIVGQVDDKKPSVIRIVAISGIVVLVVVFLLGRRSGRKKTTMVEIRRL